MYVVFLYLRQDVWFSSPSGLCDSKMSLSLTQTANHPNHPVWNQKLEPFKLPQNSVSSLANI